jgi:hypothetical protein
MEPATVVGAVAGGYLNKILPAWLVAALLALLLTAISFKLMRKGAKIFRAETHSKYRHASRSFIYSGLVGGFRSAMSALGRSASGLPAAAASGALSKPLLTPVDEEDQQPTPLPDPAGSGAVGGEREACAECGSPDCSRMASCAAADWLPDSDDGEEEEEGRRPGQAEGPGGRQQQEGAQRLDHQAPGGDAGGGLPAWRMLPVWKLGLTAALAACVVASDELKAELPCGSPLYWLAVVSVVPVALAFTLGARTYLVAQAARPGAAAAAGGWVGLPGRKGRGGLVVLPACAAGAAGGHEVQCFAVLGALRLQQEQPATREEGLAEPSAGARCCAGEVAWTPRNTLIYPLVCSSAGLIAGEAG